MWIAVQSTYSLLTYLQFRFTLKMQGFDYTPIYEFESEGYTGYTSCPHSITSLISYKHILHTTGVEKEESHCRRKKQVSRQIENGKGTVRWPRKRNLTKNKLEKR